MLKVKEIQSKKTWDKFLYSYKGFFPFFQTWEWGEVQKKLSFSVLRVGLFENEALVGISQIVEVKAKRGRYLHLRHGPILKSFTKPYLSSFFTYVRKIAQERECSFIRISPLLPKEDKTLSLFDSLGFRDAPIHNMDAEVCWVLDITKSDEELLSQMRKSHRYLIKKSLKEEVQIMKVETLNNQIVEFLNIYNHLATRRGFVPHRGLVEELEVLGEEHKAVLFLAQYQGKIIGGALVDFVGPMAIYHHGATDDTYRNLSISYLLQWEAIKEAKKREKTIYNFWGIAPIESKKHPWYGLTLFKTGFGGEKKEFVHAKDLPLSFMYWKTYAIEMISKVRKGY